MCLKRADVACQCSLPAIGTRTVATQLSERTLIYRRSVGVCLSNENSHPCITLFHVYNLLLCMWITGVQTRLPTSSAGVGKVETRPAEQSKGGIISTSQKPPPSPLIEWSLHEIEDDDRCVTVVTHLLLKISLSRRNRVLVSPQCCRNVGQNLCCKLLSRPSVCILITI